MQRLGSLWLFVAADHGFRSGRRAREGLNFRQLPSWQRCRRSRPSPDLGPCFRPCSFSLPTKTSRTSSTSRRNTSSPASRRASPTRHASSCGVPSTRRSSAASSSRSRCIQPATAGCSISFTRTLMTQGHVSLEIVTGSRPLFTTANAERYKDLEIGNNQANEILAQVGLLLKSGRPDGPA